jgi:hypothetical protein
MYRLFSGVATESFIVMCIAASAHAQTGCSCTFSTKDYSASGTKAACNALMFDGNRCEIAFSSLGADPSVAANMPRSLSEDQAYALALEHVSMLRGHAYQAMSSPEFLGRALPAMMRATYARSAVKERLPIESIDGQAMEFLGKYTPIISDIFLGKRPPLDGDWGAGYRFSIARGSLVFITPDKARLTVVVFRPE